MNNIPTKDIIEAFGGSVKPTRLPGGEGTSYKVDDIVLKPVDNQEQTNWSAETLKSMKTDGFRVSHSIKAKDGKWIYKGWQAFNYQDGEEIKSDWDIKINTSRKFHKSLRGVSKPDFIGKRNNPWDNADLAVWESDLYFRIGIEDYTNSLVSMLKPIDLPQQIIHADLTQNILFYSKLDPLIIDFSPYWRPAEYANAVIIVDSIVWEEAPDSLLDELANTFENNQLLIRAALWRIKTSDISMKDINDLVKEVSNYSHLIGLIERRELTQSRS